MVREKLDLQRLQEGVIVNPEAIKQLASYLDLAKKFENPPVVELESTPIAVKTGQKVGPRGFAVSTALQCYAPGKPALKDRDDKKSDEIADSTLKAAHLTPRMHSNNMWRITCSRSAVHDILHSTPFYNTDQQSQRYVEIEEGSYLIPANLNSEQREIFVEAANFANRAYFELLELLEPVVRERLEDQYLKGSKALGLKVAKVCQENARYVIPIGQETTFFYTINVVQLLRMLRASGLPGMTDEARYVIAQMIFTLAQEHPEILRDLDEPLKTRETFYDQKQIRAQKREFNAYLEQQSSSDPISETDKQVLIRSVRNVLGISSKKMSDSEVLTLLFDLEQNTALVDYLDAGMFDPLVATLRQLTFQAVIRISHTADSQRQRHRRTPGSTPPIEATYDGTSDYVIPDIIKGNSNLRGRFQGIMNTIYVNIEKALEAGIPLDQSLLLLPNAHALRIIESGDLFDWIHRWNQRLCLLAQTEISNVTVKQVCRFTKVIPEATKVVRTPCALRKDKGEVPFCPEGKRYCRVHGIWDEPVDQYPSRRRV